MCIGCSSLLPLRAHRNAIHRLTKPLNYIKYKIDPTESAQWACVISLCFRLTVLSLHRSQVAPALYRTCPSETSASTLDRVPLHQA